MPTFTELGDDDEPEGKDKKKSPFEKDPEGTNVEESPQRAVDTTDPTGTYVPPPDDAPHT